MTRWSAGAAMMLSVAACIPAPAPIAPAPPSRQAQAAPAPPPVPTAPTTLPLRFVIMGERTQGGVISGTVPGGTSILRLDGEVVPMASDGHFLIAFDRDAPATATLTAERVDGRPDIVETLTVAPRAWRIERLNQLARFSAPSAAFTRLREPELAAIEAARATVTDAQGWRQRFIWPATGRISGLFGAQRIYRGEPGAYHSGVDVAKPAGAPVVAPADGVVVLAADHPFTLEGNLVMIDHGMGLNSAFLHFSRIAVQQGQRVRQGELIGYVGRTGRATGPHLHWGMKWRDRRIDPLLLAPAMPTN